MKDDFEGIRFSIPYEIAVARPLRQTTLREREEILKRAHYNTELIPREMVYVDLKTDSGVSSLSTEQLAAMVGASEALPEMAVEGNKAFLPHIGAEHTREGPIGPRMRMSLPEHAIGCRGASV